MQQSGLGYMPPQASAPSKNVDEIEQQQPQETYHIYRINEANPNQIQNQMPGPSAYNNNNVPAQGEKPGYQNYDPDLRQPLNQPQSNQPQQPLFPSVQNPSGDGKFAVGYPMNLGQQTQQSQQYSMQSTHSAPLQQMYSTQPDPIQDPKTMGGQQNGKLRQNKANNQYFPQNFGRKSMDVHCPYCGGSGRTRTRPAYGGCTFVWCGVLLVLLPPLCCIPFCCPPCMDVKHYCRHCRAELGKCGPS